MPLVIVFISCRMSEGYDYDNDYSDSEIKHKKKKKKVKKVGNRSRELKLTFNSRSVEIPPLR